MTLRIERRSAVDGDASWGRGLHPVLRRIYAARGVRGDDDLSLSLSTLLPVGTLDGVDAAVELLLAHRGAGRKVLVVGDFDADGATSSVLIVRALRAWGFAAVDFLVPNRFEFGYGLTPEIVALGAERAPTLIVTVDNGVASLAGVAAARARGIDVLVTDHHLPGAELPAANVMVNPNLAGSRFASRTLAGVGVAFYVMVALKRALDAAGLVDPAAPPPAEWLDLVALGTVADVVPLDRNNRVLVTQGLARIRAGRCVPGIRALLDIAKRDRADLVAADLGFAIAPRLNAAGRLDDMSIGIRCLLADREADARALAARLDQLNAERRAIESRMQAEALAAVRQLGTLATPGSRSRAGVCLYHGEWHQGVVGLVASRVKERVRRPVVAFANGGDGLLRGSARSVAGVHVRDVFENIAATHPGLIVRFGGHAMAAGLTLEPARLDAFAAAFDAEVARWLGAGADVDRLDTDGELDAADLCLATAEALRRGGPWGAAFPEPVFDGRFTIERARVVGEKHVKMWVETAGGARRYDAIAFNLLADSAACLPAGEVHLVYRLDVNVYQGERRLQLLVDHVLPA
ncbi:MAG: Single-stranded-DNA-specific exonuclease RecJ [Steroidobacteraceae bacterium]|nr:Single-stranded-DNA-specific exonuclease RecJ [Steroidobacteraceae bacterium]